MEDDHQYGGSNTNSNTNANAMADLRQFFSPIPTHHHHFPPPQAAHHGLFPSAGGAFTPLPHHYEGVMMVAAAGGMNEFRSDSTATSSGAAAGGMTAANSGAGGGFDVEGVWGGGGFGLGVSGGGDVGATARWPRQETLTLLEIRSRLDHKFKEANHKGPLWDEVSRIMSEEHGYQRNGKKCREKFENLYKYYKKTKEGKAGRQDGKHYRFFRQLEALYGESNHAHQMEQTHLNMIGNSNSAATPLHFHGANANASGQEGFHSISLSNSSSDFDTSSSEGNDVERVGSMENGESSMDMAARSRRRRGRKGWRVKIKEFIDSQMRKIIEKQEEWLEKMMRTLESKEQERVSREEEWRKQEAQRMEREHKFWADERAWIEARDKALMDALQRITGKEIAVMENDLSSDHTEELLMAARNHHKQRQTQEEEEDNSGDVNDDHGLGNEDRWTESEIAKLIEVRTSLEARIEQCSGLEEDNVWEEVSRRMVCLGFDKSAKMCKEKWNFINKFAGERGGIINKLMSKKRKENWKSTTTRSIDCNSYHQHLQSTQGNHHVYNYGEISSSQGGLGLGQPELGLNQAMNDSCLRILLGEGGESHLWESYGIKLNRGESNHE